MRGMIIGIGMMAIFAMAQPASAEDVYVRGPGVSIGVDTGHRDRVIERRVVRDRDFARGDCKTVIIKRDGYTKKFVAAIEPWNRSDRQPGHSFGSRPGLCFEMDGTPRGTFAFRKKDACQRTLREPKQVPARSPGIEGQQHNWRFLYAL